MKKKILKGVAVYLALSMLFQIIAPTLAMALTSGPSQPEMESFEPIGTTEMVDPFSGDFNYNIPLITVPGPNGGYPVNMSYHSGIGMEQEATWVGLGWNINAGEINREMRGIPDDFNQDKITKEMNIRPNRTAEIGISAAPEIVSLDIQRLGINMGARIVWNNYKGIGIGHGFGFTFNNGKSSSNSGKTFGGGVSIDNQPFGGTDIRANLSFGKATQDRAKSFNVGVTHSSIEGIKNFSFSFKASKARIKSTTRYTYTYRNFLNGGKLTQGVGYKNTYGNTAFGAGASFSGSSFMPHATLPNTGFNVGLSLKFGADAALILWHLGLSASYSQNQLKDRQKDFASYGYLYSQNRMAGGTGDNQDFALMDFNREKDVDLCKDIPAMPVSSFTNDVYLIKGQGVGAVFRPRRADVGIMHDPVIKSETYGGTLGIELGPGAPATQIGGDLSLSFSQSYSGPWRNESLWSELINNYRFTSTATTAPLYEPVYFKATGDMSTNFEGNDFGNVGGGAIPIDMKLRLKDFLSLSPEDSFNPMVETGIVDGNGVLPNAAQSNNNARQSRSQLMSYKTVSQIKNSLNYKESWSKNVYNNVSDFPRTIAPTTPDWNSDASGRMTGHHIGEISVINPDGNRYIYSIPVYNLSQEEVSFSVRGVGVGPDDNIISNSDKLVTFTAEDASRDNKKCDDHYYSSTRVPAYAHSYLLTTIISPDYVDLTGDGPTDDDYGYYVKFNYTKINNYNWRSPYSKANYLKGFYDTNLDDKAGFTYGTKEIWYLNSIETKTHVAEFTLSERLDGYGAGNRNQNDPTLVGASTLKRLEKIDLYSKGDNYYGSSSPKPIKTVHFEYNYDLCGNVENNLGPALPENVNKGKLTLKKVWFSYGNNQKGKLSPYVFDYGERILDSSGMPGAIDAAKNPNYNVMQMDRWGNYKPIFNPILEGTCSENPYVNQMKDYDGVGGVTTLDETLRKNAASAWCLRRIVLPSGGEINVDYEQDDYGSVQERTPMQMARIIGFSKDLGVDIDSELKGNKNQIVYFEVEDQSLVSDADIAPYVAGLSEIYFKAMMRLKEDGPASGVDAYDYVEGYADLEQMVQGSTFGLYIDGTTRMGWLKVKQVGIQDINTSAQDKIHPFRKAGLQYLKLRRTDLLYPSSNNDSQADDDVASYIVQLLSTVVTNTFDNMALFEGYYNACITAGYCNKIIDIGNPKYKPSFIRVNSPDGNKYGGGHRVKSISISDIWSESDNPLTPAVDGETISKYGQQYFYKLTNGRSSGVAEYEPLIGGEEIPHHKPVRYSSPYFIVKHDDLYLEEPIGESYFPDANVGYSRVVVKSLEHTDDVSAVVQKTANGIMEYEFYTARDFPVSVAKSNLTHKKFTPKIPIPFIGDVSFEDHGFSQRYTIETNDMHGKLKAVSTYSYSANLFDLSLPISTPITQTKYIYKTDAEYTSTGTNHLNNKVDVLYLDAYYKQAEVGLNRDFFVDMREESSAAITQGMQANIQQFYTPPVPLTIFLPIISWAESQWRSVVAMDIYGRNGILMETVEINEGSKVSSKNLMFDAATGKPLLTTVTNNFDKPVYSYEYAAHWAYDGMGPAYKNIGAYLSFSTDGTSLCSSSGASNYLIVGDEVHISEVSSGTYPLPLYVVTGISGNDFNLKSIGNISPTVPPPSITGKLIVTRSGRRNQQVISNGNIVSLSNPVSDRKFPLFDRWNLYVDNGITPFLNTTNQIPPSGYNDMAFTDCADPSKRFSGFVTHGGSDPNDIIFTIEGCGIEVYRIKFPSSVAAFSTSFHLKKAGSKVYAIDLATGNILIGDWIKPADGGCLKECFEGVLHAEASEYKDSWVTAMASIVEDVNNNNYVPSVIPTALDMTNDPYLYGGVGIWRNWKAHVFQINRKQTTVNTNIAKDGTYDNFVLFDWQATNPDWTKTIEVTKYSPYGFELENDDALKLKSSAIYGYNNSLLTAISANASYFETAFDGFEDYNSSTYIINKGHGHVNLMPFPFSGPGFFGVDDQYAHSGKNSASIPSGRSTRFTTNSVNHFVPVVGRKYVISAWFFGSAGSIPALTIPSGATVNLTTIGEPIEGWRKCDVVFTATSATVVFDFNITGAVGNKRMDDVRIMPFQSTIKTYVYDPKTLWLSAELDNQNYAIFYNYDEEGTLTQVKKETVKGIFTIKTTRSNVKR